jgi:hypothetical protein
MTRKKIENPPAQDKVKNLWKASKIAIPCVKCPYGTMKSFGATNGKLRIKCRPCDGHEESCGRTANLVAEVIPALKKEGFESAVNALLSSSAMDLPILKPTPQLSHDGIQPLQARQDMTEKEKIATKNTIQLEKTKNTIQLERRMDLLEKKMMENTRRRVTHPHEQEQGSRGRDT